MLYQEARHQKFFADAFFASAPDAFAQATIFQQLNNPTRAHLDGRNEKTVRAVLNLMWNAANISGDDWRAFPHRFGDGEAKAFADGFLQNNRRAGLNRVDKSGVVAVWQYQNTFFAVCEQRFVNFRAFGIVG